MANLDSQINRTANTTAALINCLNLGLQPTYRLKVYDLRRARTWKQSSRGTVLVEGPISEIGKFDRELKRFRSSKNVCFWWERLDPDGTWTECLKPIK